MDAKAIDRGPAPSEDQADLLKERVDGELISLLWRSAVGATIIHPLLIVAVYFVIEGQVPALSLWIWISVFAVLVMGRVIMVSAWVIRKPQGKERLRWGRYFLATMLLSVGFWGSAGPLFLHQLGPVEQIFIFVMVLGTAGASVTAYSPHRPTMIIVPAVMLLPLAAAAMFLGEQAYAILGACVVLYYLYLMRAGLDHHKTVAEAQRLRFQRSELAENLRAARDAAQDANEAKSLFLANMSHELRTPLNAILGFSEMIKLKVGGSNAGKRDVEYAGLIHHSGSHLLSLINDLLDVSKAEAGKIELNKEKIEVGDLVTSCLRLIEPAAEQAGVLIEAPKKGEAVPLYADARKMRQVVLNLLANAMKFTPSGGLVSIVYGVPSEGSVTLSISDNGIGMTPEQQKRAMQPFVQIEQGYDNAVPGTGLGLPLAKKLVELHDGSFEMISAPGEGTTVTVELPSGELKRAVKPPVAPSTCAPKGMRARA